jgi:hypothetical protein
MRPSRRRCLAVRSGFVVLVSSLASVAAAQGPSARPTLAERLGHAPDSKLVIVHTDDLDRPKETR